MFRDKLKKMLEKENPLDSDVKATHVGPVEVVIEAHGGKIDDLPDFFKIFDEKNLTNDAEHDILSDDDHLEIKALKMLIDKYKREK